MPNDFGNGFSDGLCLTSSGTFSLRVNSSSFGENPVDVLIGELHT